ncbi:MAG: hypothetical protein P4M11_10840 [Candidatus Pacebacteria bacterium]|nr:hypothetical protein [Candidatus Paceibacterota bacterium]
MGSQQYAQTLAASPPAFSIRAATFLIFAVCIVIEIIACSLLQLVAVLTLSNSLSILIL